VANSRALRRAVPRLSIEAVIEARPVRSAGSTTLPAGMLPRRANVALAGFSWTITEMPFSSW
jgi:hypothetical protein